MVFGSTFVAQDEETARNIMASEKARTAVTLKGDKYSCEGTLSGGANA